MTPLADFQDGFARALVSIEPPPGLPAEVERIARQLAFSVYRNTVLKGWIDALEGNFPAVARLVGDEWFRGAAAVYARGNPPRSPVLATYGDRFAEFLESFAPAAELPYLPSVARLDRMWSEAHVAADAPVLTAAACAALRPQELVEAVAVPHPAARLAWFHHTGPTIWFDARGLAPDADTILFEPQGEGALITRPHGVVAARKLTAGAHAFLDACGMGRTLGEACGVALAEEPELDVAVLTAELLQAGAFTTLTLRSDPQDRRGHDVRRPL